ncbi:MAG TPA: NfeD family protein [Stellaceae bacterium]|nr:NfeD family protein [Stellaceae bacterium]
MAYWIWLALGFGLAALEAVTVTFVLIWFGIAAVIVGLAVWAMPGLDEWVQFGGFGALSLALLVPAWMIRRRLRQHGHPMRPELINDRAAQYVGRTIVLAEPITHGQGRAFIGDTLWQLSGPDLEAGRAVRVVGSRGMVLRVQATEAT